MTVEDCFELGKVAYAEADYYHTELWMAQALKQLDDGEDSSVDKVTVMDYLSYAIYQQGEMDRALELTKKMLKLDPTHQRANGNLRYFEVQLEKQRKAEAAAESEKTEKRQVDKRDAQMTRSKDPLPERKRYEQLCRGEGLKMNPRRQSRLFCRYHDNKRNPRLLLAPVKQEDEWDRPHIVRYHNIISEYEMRKIKELAKPRLKRATVHDPATGKLTTAQYRVSKSAWLSSYEHTVIERINQRIEDITGLDMLTAEELQVANYGVSEDNMSRISILAGEQQYSGITFSPMEREIIAQGTQPVLFWWAASGCRINGSTSEGRSLDDPAASVRQNDKQRTLPPFSPPLPPPLVHP
ncbi:Prolyl 4-hydroxylase subunit alpha-1 [Bagarius yarrelli]|uniref:Prolyl 4-hydroxylase subunit alpha-1 n=1 Tax=Bagarius yarrelli TaxID=175774 RepID=A0A556V2X0_BAGYA|nr:Prolyl 4-hydroxylase subunit alpha-1 [Bagarius yarrelli]